MAEVETIRVEQDEAGMRVDRWFRRLQLLSAYFFREARDRGHP